MVDPELLDWLLAGDPSVAWQAQRDLIGDPPLAGDEITGVRHLLDGATWVKGGVSYWATHRFAERCVNGMVLALAAYFDVEDPRTDELAMTLIDGRVGDGDVGTADGRSALATPG